MIRARVKGLLARWRHVLFRRAADREMDEELRFHLDMETQKLVRSGLSAAEARRRALVAFGGVERYREAMREGRRAPVLDPLLSDLRFAWRSLRRDPGFAVVAVVTAGLGVGATTAVFSIANAALLRPPSLPDPDRVVVVQERRRVNISNGIEGTRVPYARFREYEEGSGEVFSRLAGHHLDRFSLRLDERTVAVQGALVTGGYFTVLGIPPEMGRFPDSDDAREIVLGHRFWQDQLGGDPNVLGSTLHVDSRPLTVVGVAPAWFTGPVLGSACDVWVPLRARTDARGAAWGAAWVAMLGRLRPGVSKDRAEAVVDALAKSIPPEPPARVDGARLEAFTGLPGQGRVRVAGFMTLLLGLAFLVLLIASANIGGTLFARALTRRRETAVRLALGAGRARLVRHLLAESLALFLLGGSLGVGLAWAATAWVSGLPLPTPGATSFDVSPDGRVLAFALFLTCGAGIAFGLVPAIQASRHDVLSALKEGATGGGVERIRLRRLFVSGQVAMSVLLLLMATLFTRSFLNGLSMDPGFDPRGVVVATTNLAPHGYDEAGGRAFYARLLDRASRLPGVQSAALAQFVLLSGNALGSDVETEEPATDGMSRSWAQWNAVSPSWFATLGVKLVTGRAFSAADDEGDAPVAVVNQTVADRLWPGQNPLGRRFRAGSTEFTVVGVARGGKYSAMYESPVPYVFVPMAQRYAARMALHVRAPGAEEATLRAVRRIVRELDPDVAVEDAAPLSTTLNGALFPYRFTAALVGIFGVIGLVLSAVGVFSVLSFQVARRTREFGVRRTLGAGRRDLLAGVMLDGAWLAATGCAVGQVLGAAVALLLRRGLLELSPLDPVTFLGVPAVLFLAAVIAGAVPAWRAGSVEAVEALREE